jgi:hypothetical protein
MRSRLDIDPDFEYKPTPDALLWALGCVALGMVAAMALVLTVAWLISQALR